MDPVEEAQYRAEILTTIGTQTWASDDLVDRLLTRHGLIWRLNEAVAGQQQTVHDMGEMLSMTEDQLTRASNERDALLQAYTDRAQAWEILESAYVALQMIADHRSMCSNPHDHAQMQILARVVAAMLGENRFIEGFDETTEDLLGAMEQVRDNLRQLHDQVGGDTGR